jgi:hypothetical protein
MKILRFIIELYRLQWNELNFSPIPRTTRRLYIVMACIGVTVYTGCLASAGILRQPLVITNALATVGGIIAAQVMTYSQQWCRQTMMQRRLPRLHFEYHYSLQLSVAVYAFWLSFLATVAAVISLILFVLSHKPQ